MNLGSYKGGDRTKVAAARCADYEFATVQKALREALAPLGGMAAFVRPGEVIALKPNVLAPLPPERAVVTHPAVVAAVAVEVKDAGATPVVVESPGVGVVHVRPIIERSFRKVGYVQAARRHGFELSFDTGWESVSAPEAVLAKRFEVMTPIIRADGVINLPKLKTHMFMTLSAAIKNLFGVIPGLNKAAHHARLNDPKRFAHMLLDLAGLVAPRLNIVDAVLGMEGDGPGSGGTPRTIGALLAGADAVLVDVACCRIIGMDTNAVPTLVAARERHMWSGHATDVETLGVPIADLRVEGFVMPGSMTGIGVGPLGLMEEPARRFLRRFNKWPVPKTGRCTLCGSCERGCPAGAISLEQAAEVARVDDSKCIRCYCCHEVCPEAAIDLEYSWMGAFLHRMRVV